jgi:hypothetical protein
LEAFFSQQDSQVKQSKIWHWVSWLLIRDAPQLTVFKEKILTHLPTQFLVECCLHVGHAGCHALFTGGEGSDFEDAKQGSTSWHSYLF